MHDAKRCRRHVFLHAEVSPHHRWGWNAVDCGDASSGLAFAMSHAPGPRPHAKDGGVCTLTAARSREALMNKNHVVLVLSALALPSPSLVTAATSETHRDAAHAATGAFVANLGQLDGPARYYAVGGNTAVYFEPASILLDRRPESSADRGVVLRVGFPGAQGRPAPLAETPGESHVSVFTGNEPARWRAGVPTYAAVRYRDIAPGADLVYRMDQG